MLWLFACTGQNIPSDSADFEVTTAFAAESSHRYVQIETAVEFDVGESTGVSFLWDFGDGNQGQGLEVTHVYTNPGVYPVVLTAIGSDGLQNSTTRKITAHNPLLAEPPQTSSTIAIHGNDIWSIFPEAGTLHRFSLQTQQQDSFDICTDPRQLITSQDHVAVTCLDELILFHIPTEEIVQISLPTGSSPYGITGSVDNWWITLSAIGELAYWNGIELTTFSLGTDPRALTQSGDDLYSPRWRSSSTGGEMYHFTAEQVQTHWLEIDYSGDSDNTTGGIPNLLESMTLSPDGTQFSIPMLHANILIGDYRSGTSLKHDNMVRAMLAKVTIDLQEKAEDRKHFDEKGRSIAVAFSPYGDRLYVLHPGVQNVSVLNAYTGQFLGSLHQTGVGSTGIAVSEEVIVINSWLSRQVKVYQNQAPYNLLWEQEFAAPDPLSEQVLLGKYIFNDASDSRMTKVGYISCAHCHPNADHDGQTWDFTDRGEGLRNTTTLIARGGTDMGRLHWSGNFDEMQDFETDIREHFGGSGFLSEQDYAQYREPLGPAKTGLSVELDALAAYTKFLVEPLPSPYTSPVEGAALFAETGCVECHPAPFYTDSTLIDPVRHDIGTITTASGNRLGQPLDGIDTPSLIGVWSSAPYLHDGSAHSIEEAIQAHEGIPVLTHENLHLLVQFVISL